MSRDYFDRLYDASDDPWDLASSAYEQRKYETTVAMLAGRAVRRAFEPGCSIGVLTERLAAATRELVAWDVSPVAVAQARARVAAEHVRIDVGCVPDSWPEGTFDLVVISELAYYLEATERRHLLARVVDCLAPGGVLLAVHWVHAFAEAATDGRTVHAEICATDGLVRSAQHSDPDFLVDLLTRDD